MSRPTRATISLSALAHNLEQARLAAPNSKVMAVIKANGYGHGLTSVAKGLKQADGFAVACIEEACELREAGFKQKILLLEGVFVANELDLVKQLNLDIVVHSEKQIEWLESRSAANNFSVWLKVNTGMHRIGFAADEFKKQYTRLNKIEAINILILMTHCASADDRQNNYTKQQHNLFTELCAGLPEKKTLVNSAGLLSQEESHFDWVRPGIMLYGVSPFNDSIAQDHELKAVMRVESEIIAINSQKKGDLIGYGGRFKCPEDMLIGVVAIGYGDGYPRQAANGTPILVDNIRTQLIGRVSMDMIMVDLRPIRDARIGSSVILWGSEKLSIEEIASHSSTISYELLCRVTARLKKIEIS